MDITHTHNIIKTELTAILYYSIYVKFQQTKLIYAVRSQNRSYVGANDWKQAQGLLGSW